MAHPHITFDSSTARLKRWLIWAPFCDLETFIGSQPKLYSILSLFYSEHKKEDIPGMRVVLSNQNCQLSGFMFIYAGRLKDQKDFPETLFFLLLLSPICVVQKVGVAIKKVKKEREKKERDRVGLHGWSTVKEQPTSLMNSHKVVFSFRHADLAAVSFFTGTTYSKTREGSRGLWVD